MRIATVFIAFAAMVTSVYAIPRVTNAERLSRGLPPLPPVRRATSVHGARGSTPSGQPSQSCGNSGSMYCCNSVMTSDEASGGILGGLLGGITGLVGSNCSPLTVIGLGAGTCSSNTVCCTDNHYSGLIVLGCVPITL